MPKIVDHTAYRGDLAQRAALLFSRFGYSGLGMRQIASELGISKSALYHYFPTKNDLFAACTDAVTHQAAEQADHFAKFSAEASDEDRIVALRGLFDKLAPIFPSEISLLVDYLRGRSAPQIAQDNSMELANRRYHQLMVAIVGERNATAVFSLLTGAILRRYFDGNQTDFSDIEDGLRAILNAKA